MAASVAATTTLLNIAWGFAGSAVQSYESRNVDLIVVRAGVAERITSSLSASLARRLSALPEIAGVDGTLTEMVSFGQQTLVGIPLHGLDPTGFAIQNLNVVSGRALSVNDRHAVLLGTPWRGRWKKVGRVHRNRASPLPHRGDLQDGQCPGIEHGGRSACRRTGIDGTSRAGLRVSGSCGPGATGETSLARLCRQIESLRDEKGRSLGFKAMPTRQFVDSDTEARLAKAMAWGTTVITGILSLVGMLNTMLMSVLERTRIGNSARSAGRGGGSCGSFWASRW